MSAEVRNIRRLFRAVLSNAMLDYRKEWLKYPDRRERTEGDARRYLNSADGREIIDLCGWEFGPRQIGQALAEITGPKGGPMDYGSRYVRRAA